MGRPRLSAVAWIPREVNPCAYQRVPASLDGTPGSVSRVSTSTSEGIAVTVTRLQLMELTSPPPVHLSSRRPPAASPDKRRGVNGRAVGGWRGRLGRFECGWVVLRWSGVSVSTGSDGERVEGCRRGSPSPTRSVAPVALQARAPEAVAALGVADAALHSDPVSGRGGAGCGVEPASGRPATKIGRASGSAIDTSRSLIFSCRGRAWRSARLCARNARRAPPAPRLP
jgi:hypothetical protein